MADRDRFADEERGDENRVAAPPRPDNSQRLLELNQSPGLPSPPPSLAVANRQASQHREATSGAAFSADQSQRETVGAAFAFHAGQRYAELNISQDFVSRVSDRWFELFGEDPAMMSGIMSDAQAVAALTDADVAEKVSAGEDLSGFGDIWDSIVEVAWEVGAKEDAVALVSQQADAVKGRFDNLSIFDGFAVQQEAAEQGIKSAVMPAFEDGGVWSYDQNANLLAVTIGTGDDGFTVGLEPRAGFDPTDAVGVLAEVVWASTHGNLVGELEQRGVIDRILEAADDIGGFVDGRPELGQTIDALWEGFTSLTVVGLLTDDEGDTGPIGRARRRIEQEKVELEQTVGYSPPIAMGFPVEMLIAKVTEDIIRTGAEQGVDITTEDALAVAADAVQNPAERAQLKSEWWDLTKEQIVADAEAALDDTSSVRKAVESGLGTVLQGLEWWDSVAQRIGLTVFGQVEGVASLGLSTLQGDPAEGFELFKKAMEKAGSADKASDYFGIDQSSSEWVQGFGDAANLAVGVGFDPLNFLFPGAKGARSLFRKALTNSNYAELFVRQGGIRQFTKTIANDVGGRAIGNVLYVAAEGMSDDGIRSLIKLANSSTSTVADVEKVILRELPNTDGVGWFLGGGPNRAIRHSTMDGIGRMYESVAGGKLSDAAQQRVFELTMQLRRTRAIDLGENMALGNFADEVMMLFPNDPDKALEWFTRALDALEGTSRTQKAGAAAALKQKAGDKVRAVNRHRDNANAAVDVRGVRKNLDEVKDSLRKVDDLPTRVPDAGFVNTGEDLLHGTRNQFDKFDTSQAGPGAGRGRIGGPQRPEQGAKFYFTDQEEVASRFAEAGIPSSSLDDLSRRSFDLDPEDVTAADLDSLFSEQQTILIGTEVDDAGQFVYEVAHNGEDLLAKAERSGLSWDEIEVRQLDPRNAPRVVRTTVYGEKIDLTGEINFGLYPDGLEDALRADRLMDDAAGFQGRLASWQSHEARFANTAKWMREHGYGKAIVPDAAESGGQSIIGLAEYIGKADEVAERLGKVTDHAERIRTTLRRQARLLDDKLAEAQGRLSTYSASAREANKAVTQAARFEGDMAVQPSRAAMAEEFHRMYDDIAKELNEEFADVADELGVDELIPVIKDSQGRVTMNPHAPDVPLRDWSEVTGTPRAQKEGLETVSMAGGLTLADVELADAVNAIGMLQRQQRVLTPVSPYELMLYRSIRRNLPAYRAFRNHAAGEVVHSVTRGMKLMFGLNLLLNPITMAKVTIDETLRFFAQTGLLGKTAKATLAGMPGAQLAMTGLRRVGVPDATRAVAQTLGEFAPVFRRIPGWGKLENAKGVWAKNPWALQHMRSHEGFLDAASFQWISRSTPGVSKQGYVQQAERWVNGTLMNDPVFKAYAKSLPDAKSLGSLSPNEFPVPESFVRWWNEGDEGIAPGRTFAKTDEFIVKAGPGAQSLPVAVDAQFAWDTVQRAYNSWVDNLVSEGQRDAIRRRLVEAVSDRALRMSIADDFHLFLAIDQVPGLAPEGGRMARGIGKVFNGGFGNPSARRSGVFFEHFYDEAHQIYTEAYQNKGRLITKDMLVERGFDEAAALEMLAHGSDNAVVRKLMDELGAVTEQQIEANAARYASLRADDLMYRFTAGSLAGQGVESGLLFPFARAQMDFLSWWSDHLTRPLQLREGLQRVLPDAAVNTIQSIPLNLRAMGKYAHLTSTLNNELQSPLDDAIDKLTFFPFRFDNEFFLDVLPQPGPLPSWLIDVYAEGGLLPPEAIDAIATFYPTLEYTDATNGWFDGMFPNSRRSLRDATAGMMRGVAQLTGTPPGQWQEGMMASTYNWLSQNRLPAATGDFTAFHAMEFLRDNALGEGDLDVPGSQTWNDTVNELTRQAALEANRVEMGQDLKDRINPISSVDREYRSLHAYERMLGDPAMFSLLADYQVLSSSDLFEEDGENRLQSTYNRFLSGQASDEDKKFLDDTLARIFHDSRRAQVVDAIPDFSVMDLMLLKYPELAVNLVSKWECSGAQVNTSEHRAFHNSHCNPQTGRLHDLPPGPAGSELFREARANGWVANRPAFGTEASDGGWVRDAHEAVHLSARRAVDAVWFHAVGKEWRGRISQKDAARTVTVTPFITAVLEPLGVEWEEGSTMTGGDLFSALGAMRDRYKVESNAPLNLLDRGPVKQQLERHPFGQQLLDQLSDVESVLADNGITTFEEWPEEVKAVARDQFSTAIELGVTTKADYDQHVASLFGDLDFKVSAPTGLDDVEAGLTFEPEQLRDGTVEVVDGDTLSLVTEDGPLRVRLIGINAPEVTQPGYTEARNNLINLIRNSDRVDLAVYKPELFGVTQLTAPGEERLLMWLLVDGVPIYDVSVFTSDNPRGAGVGGTVLDLNEILEAGSGAR